MAGSIRIEHLLVTRGSFTLRVDELTVSPREIFAILGETGAGKTVLLEAIAGAYPVDEGAIELDGKNIETLPVQQRHLGIVYQDYALFPHMSVAENIGYGLKMNDVPADEATRRIERQLSLFGIERIADRFPGIISGGESQRCALARALVMEPEILLLDEPFNGLDPEATREMRSALMRLNRERGVSMVISSHVLDQLDRMATRFGVIRSGRMVREFSVDELHAACMSSVRVKTADPSRSLALLEECLPGATLRMEPDGSILVSGASGVRPAQASFGGAATDASASGAPTTEDVSRALAETGQMILELTLIERDIEEYFVDLMDGTDEHA